MNASFQVFVGDQASVFHALFARGFYCFKTSFDSRNEEG